MHIYIWQIGVLMTRLAQKAYICVIRITEHGNPVYQSYCRIAA